MITLVSHDLSAFVSNKWQGVLSFTQGRLDRLLGDDAEQQQQQQQERAAAPASAPARDGSTDKEHITLFTLTHRVGGQLKRRVVRATQDGKERVIQALPESLHARDRLKQVETKAEAAISVVRQAKDQAVNKGLAARDAGMRKIHDIQDTATQARDAALQKTKQTRDQVLNRAFQAQEKARSVTKTVADSGSQRLCSSADRILEGIRARVPAAIAPPSLPELQERFQTAKKELPPRIRNLLQRSKTLGCSGVGYILSRRVFQLPSDSLQYLGHVYRSLRVRGPETQWQKHPKFQRLDQEITDLANALRDLFIWKTGGQSAENSGQRRDETRGNNREEKTDENFMDLPSAQDLKDVTQQTPEQASLSLPRDAGQPPVPLEGEAAEDLLELDRLAATNVLPDPQNPIPSDALASSTALSSVSKQKKKTKKKTNNRRKSKA